MKFNTLFVAAVFASTTLSSCVFKTAEERQLKYTHTTLVDGDAYAFFRKVGSIAPYEVSYAKYVGTVGNAQAKDAANKVSQFYSEILPQMDSLATTYHVDFPILGVAEFVAPGQGPAATVVPAAVITPAVDVADSTAAAHQAVAVHAEEAVHADHTGAYSDAAYLHHALHQVTLVKEQIRRMTTNTNKDIRDFAHAKTEAVAQLFTALGGKEDAHGHH